MLQALHFQDEMEWEGSRRRGLCSWAVVMVVVVVVVVVGMRERCGGVCGVVWCGR